MFTNAFEIHYNDGGRNYYSRLNKEGKAIPTKGLGTKKVFWELRHKHPPSGNPQAMFYLRHLDAMVSIARNGEVHRVRFNGLSTHYSKGEMWLNLKHCLVPPSLKLPLYVLQNNNSCHAPTE